MNEPYTLASKRADAPTGCAYVAPLFWNKWFRWDAGHPATTSWANALRTSTTPACRFSQMASGTRSRHLPLIGASRGRPVRSRTFWERRLEHEA